MMAAFGDRIQSLMDEVYGEWKKDGNRDKGKWDILEGFSEAHQIAVVFGNFNYQVENGGISQWIYNGYFHDDAEKFTEFLEAGAVSDERCQNILDALRKLGRCAAETDCGRDGYFHDSDDGERGFIGDIIEYDFDDWYYDHCGEADWWETVCGIIDHVDTRAVAPDRQDEVGLFLYSVEYRDWNESFSDLIKRSVTVVGKDDADAVENAKRMARPDSRDFEASRITTVMGMEISVSPPGTQPKLGKVYPFPEDRPLGIDHCIPGGMDGDLKGKVVAINPECLQPKYREMPY